MVNTNDRLFIRLMLAGLVAAVITITIWLAYNSNSPVYGFLSGTWALRIIEIVIGALNILPIMLGAWLGIIISRNPHNINYIPMYVLMFLQWFIIAFLFSRRILRRFSPET